MKSSYIFTLGVIVFLLNSAASAETKEDRLKCSGFIKNINNHPISAILFTQMIQSTILFSHKVNHDFIDSMEKDSGKKASKEDMYKLYADSHFAIEITLKLMTPKKVVEQCKENPSMFLEEIGRKAYVSTLKLIPKYPEMNWNQRYIKKFKRSLAQ